MLWKVIHMAENSLSMKGINTVYLTRALDYMRHALNRRIWRDFGAGLVAAECALQDEGTEHKLQVSLTSCIVGFTDIVLSQELFNINILTAEASSFQSSKIFQTKDTASLLMVTD